MGLGLVTDKLSTREELLKERNTTGSGAPTHTPDVATGQRYEWWAGAWH